MYRACKGPYSDGAPTDLTRINEVKRTLPHSKRHASFLCSSVYIIRNNGLVPGNMHPLLADRIYITHDFM